MQKRILLLLASVAVSLVLLYKLSIPMQTTISNSIPLVTYSVKSSPLTASSIGIFVMHDEDYITEQEQHIASLICYAHRHSYQFVFMRPERYPSCIHIATLAFFKKHCMVSLYLLENPHIQWLMVLDHDVLVLNMSKKIEPFLPLPENNGSDIHLVLYERFNGEISAGNYLVHNDAWSHSFLIRWIAHEYVIGKFPNNNHDNGALHLHLLDELLRNETRSRYDDCFELYGKVNGTKDYHNFVGCCKCALDGRWDFEHIRILRRGHSFVRDNLHSELAKRIWSPTDFLLHGQKDNLGRYYKTEIDPKQCRTASWKLPIIESAIATDFGYVRTTIGALDKASAKSYPKSVGVADIAECWPNCVNTEARRQTFLRKVCSKYHTF